MNSRLAPPIPPAGERKDYICKLSTREHGLWILKRDDNIAAFQDAIASGLTDDQAMEKLGGTFYATVDRASKPPKELIRKAEAAYSLLAESGERFHAALKSSEIEKSVWYFIVNTDPWFRPRGSARGTLLLHDKVGRGVWVINGSDEAKFQIFKNRESGVDDVDLIEESGGIHYENMEELEAAESKARTIHE